MPVITLVAIVVTMLLVVMPEVARATCAPHGFVASGRPAPATASPGSPAGTPAPKSDSAPAPKTESAPAPKTDGAPAPKTDTAPAPKSDAAPAAKNEQAAAVAAPQLDLAGLEKRLRDTSAIGVFTKLSLKNQVDDLLEEFKAFHERRGNVKLEDLRERYNLLMLKVLSLLQSKDPRLAGDLTASREAIWGVLVDPVKFSTVTGGG